MAEEDRVCDLIKLLLYVAREEGAEVTATKLQKIFFLLEKEKGISLDLEFVPWLFGPYSEKLQDLLDKLIEMGEVGVKEEEVRDALTKEVVGYKRSYVLNDEGYRPSEEHEESEIAEFFREWVKKSRDEILAYVYEKYPEYSRYPLVRDKILGR